MLICVTRHSGSLHIWELSSAVYWLLCLCCSFHYIQLIVINKFKYHCIGSVDDGFHYCSSVVCCCMSVTCYMRYSRVHSAITVCMWLLTYAEMFVMLWICRQFIWGKDWNWQWGCHGVSTINDTEHQPYTYFDIKVWSRIFAENVQSVSI